MFEKEGKTVNETYINEYVTFDALKQYGVEFEDVMSAADNGIVSRREHINSRGSVVYTFRRGDVINYCNGRNDGE